MLAIRTILCPTDFSESADAAFLLARSLARDYHAKLVVLHARYRPTTPPEMAAAEPPLETRQHLLDRLHALPLENSQTPVDYRVVDGPPFDVILDTAKAVGADLIVLGTHGRSGISRLIMGSVAESVNRKALCPVVTVRGGAGRNTEPTFAPNTATTMAAEWAGVVPIVEDPVREVVIPVGPHALRGTLRWTGKPRGVVVFAHGSGSSRHSPRNRYVASILNDAGFATLLMDLLTEDEADAREKVFDVELLANRLAAAGEWVTSEPDMTGLPVGYFGASTGSAAALIAAAAAPDRVSAVVSRGGRPDLAWDDLPAVAAPTLLIVGADDEPVLGWNRDALEQLNCTKELAVVPGATHLFEEPGALELVAELAERWFTRHLRIGSSQQVRADGGPQVLKGSRPRG